MMDYQVKNFDNLLNEYVEIHEGLSRVYDFKELLSKFKEKVKGFNDPYTSKLIDQGIVVAEKIGSHRLQTKILSKRLPDVKLGSKLGGVFKQRLDKGTVFGNINELVKTLSQIEKEKFSKEESHERVFNYFREKVIAVYTNVETLFDEISNTTSNNRYIMHRKHERHERYTLALHYEILLQFYLFAKNLEGILFELIETSNEKLMTQKERETYEKSSEQQRQTEFGKHFDQNGLHKNRLGQYQLGSRFMSGDEAPYSNVISVLNEKFLDKLVIASTKQSSIQDIHRLYTVLSNLNEDPIIHNLHKRNKFHSDNLGKKILKFDTLFNFLKKNGEIFGLEDAQNLDVHDIKKNLKSHDKIDHEFKELLADIQFDQISTVGYFNQDLLDKNEYKEEISKIKDHHANLSFRDEHHSHFDQVEDGFESLFMKNPEKYGIKIVNGVLSRLKNFEEDFNYVGKNLEKQLDNNEKIEEIGFIFEKDKDDNKILEAHLLKWDSGAHERFNELTKETQRSHLKIQKQEENDSNSLELEIRKNAKNDELAFNLNLDLRILLLQRRLPNQNNTDLDEEIRNINVKLESFQKSKGKYLQIFKTLQFNSLKERKQEQIKVMKNTISAAKSLKLLPDGIRNVYGVSDDGNNTAALRERKTSLSKKLPDLNLEEKLKFILSDEEYENLSSDKTFDDSYADNFENGTYQFHHGYSHEFGKGNDPKHHFAGVHPLIDGEHRFDYDHYSGDKKFKKDDDEKSEEKLQTNSVINFDHVLSNFLVEDNAKDFASTTSSLKKDDKEDEDLKEPTYTEFEKPENKEYFDEFKKLLEVRNKLQSQLKEIEKQQITTNNVLQIYTEFKKNYAELKKKYSDNQKEIDIFRRKIIEKARENNDYSLVLSFFEYEHDNKFELFPNEFENTIRQAKKEYAEYKKQVYSKIESLKEPYKDAVKIIKETNKIHFKKAKRPSIKFFQKRIEQLDKFWRKRKNELDRGVHHDDLKNSHKNISNKDEHHHSVLVNAIKKYEDGNTTTEERKKYEEYIINYCKNLEPFSNYSNLSINAIKGNSKFDKDNILKNFHEAIENYKRKYKINFNSENFKNITKTKDDDEEEEDKQGSAFDKYNQQEYDKSQLENSKERRENQYSFGNPENIDQAMIQDIEYDAEVNARDRLYRMSYDTVKKINHPFAKLYSSAEWDLAKKVIPKSKVFRALVNDEQRAAAHKILLVLGKSSSVFSTSDRERFLLNFIDKNRNFFLTKTRGYSSNRSLDSDAIPDLFSTITKEDARSMSVGNTTRRGIEPKNYNSLSDSIKNLIPEIVFNQIKTILNSNKHVQHKDSHYKQKKDTQEFDFVGGIGSDETIMNPGGQRNLKAFKGVSETQRLTYIKLLMSIAVASGSFKDVNTTTKTTLTNKILRDFDKNFSQSIGRGIKRREQSNQRGQLTGISAILREHEEVPWFNKEKYIQEAVAQIRWRRNPRTHLNKVVMTCKKGEYKKSLNKQIKIAGQTVKEVICLPIDSKPAKDKAKDRKSSIKRWRKIKANPGKMTRSNLKRKFTKKFSTTIRQGKK